MTMLTTVFDHYERLSMQSLAICHLSTKIPNYSSKKIVKLVYACEFRFTLKWIKKSISEKKIIMKILINQPAIWHPFTYAPEQMVNKILSLKHLRSEVNDIFLTHVGKVKLHLLLYHDGKSSDIITDHINDSGVIKWSPPNLLTFWAQPTA